MNQLLEQFSKVFGTRIKELRAGGAAFSPIVRAWVKECFKQCRFDEGYGTTEVGSLAASDGSMHTGVEIKLVDVPELGYFETYVSKID